MNIEEITGKTTPEEQINALRVDKTEKPKIEDLKKEWKVSQHRTIIDNDFLPNKEVKDPEGKVIKTKKVNRIAMPVQKYIVNSAVSFGFGNPITIKSNAESGSQEEIVEKAIEKILLQNKADIKNRQAARELYRSTEIAEYWYYQKSEPHEDYGFQCSFRIKVKLFIPWKNDTLYPMFNEYDDMIAFSRGFSLLNSEKKAVEYFETFTDTDVVRFMKGENGWEIVPIEGAGKNPIQKIPIVYASQEETEYEDVKYDIERLELLLSRHAEINDYHAAPTTFVKGKVTGLPQAGEANKSIQGGPESDMKVISWDAAPESVRLEIDTRLENIHKFTKTPDLFRQVKGLNQVSGIMLKMLFMDAHLKVMEKAEIWEDYFTRRYNILKAYVGKLLNTSLLEASNRLELEPVIKPYMIQDTKEWVETLMTANGNKPLISQQLSAELSTLAPSEDWLVLQAEQEAAKTESVFGNPNEL
ncbi:phage portal protein [Chryseobacterium defluvii]|uniref:SPP1 family phage portal protein n=1 Tax=Chryseobacterium defluvii TaxID=160396 RepID=A0A495SNT2_9FLAO|nr:phage portal protein [Chryseobacterium defluvii]RKT01090.1 SPP1 family phage portal protein [Chryseobacterium defluvii]